MQRTSSSCPSSTRKHAPHSMSHNLHTDMHTKCFYTVSQLNVSLLKCLNLLTYRDLIWSFLSWTDTSAATLLSFTKVIKSTLTTDSNEWELESGSANVIFMVWLSICNFIKFSYLFRWFLICGLFKLRLLVNLLRRSTSEESSTVCAGGWKEAAAAGPGDGCLLTRGQQRVSSARLFCWAQRMGELARTGSEQLSRHRCCTITKN